MAIEKVREYFAQFGIQDRIMEFDVSSATVELAAEAVGTEPERICKTLSFLKPEGGCVLIQAAGDARIDNRKFKDQFHFKAKMLKPDEVIEYTREEDVKFIRLSFCDVFGKQKNISIMPDELQRAFTHGIASTPRQLKASETKQNQIFSCIRFRIP